MRKSIPRKARPVKRVEEPRIELPTKPSEPRRSLADYSMLLYGREKVGKTTLAAQFPDALFFMCEPGGRSLRIMQVGIHNWHQFLDALKQVNASERFRTVVLDTVDLAFRFCEAYVCKRLGIEHPSDEEWGKGWGMVRDEFALAMAELINVEGRGTIFVSHAMETELRRRTGQTSHRTAPTMANQARAVLEPMVDIWAYYAYSPEGARTLRIRGDDQVAAGCRVEGHFLDPKGDGIAEIPMGRSAAEAYYNYVTAFNNESAPRSKKLIKIRRKG